MRIGKQDNAFSSICTSTPENITIRGHDLCGDLVGQLDFTSYFWLLTTGAMPSETQKFFANAVLLSIAEHGLVPSVVAARMTYAAAPEAFQGAVAAGLLGCGSVVLGSAEEAGRFYAGLVQTPAQDPENQAKQAILDLRADKKPIPGFGHPLHSAGDPRANLLLKLAEEKQIIGPHIEMVYRLRDVMSDAIGKYLPINVNGAIPAVMLDVGYPVEALKGISLLARTASLIGHLREESDRSIGFNMSNAAAEAISYDGPPPSAE